MTYEFRFLPDEHWWGGCAEDGGHMPLTAESDFSADARLVCTNQGMPLYISDRGRYIWSEEGFGVHFDRGVIRIESDLPVTMNEGGSTLRDAYLAASRTHFPFTGKVPPKEFFMTAQYNTWMEFTYGPTQEGVLAYAHAIVDHGFEPGILIIDEGWHNPYGDWTFDTRKFPDAKGMIDELHTLGFKVMLWVVPFVTCSGRPFITAIRKDLNADGTCDRLFLRNEKGEVAVTGWWNGYTAILDMTDEANREYLDRQLRALMKDLGVDGFKFDGGSIMCYQNDRAINGPYKGTAAGTYSPLKQNIAWNDFGTRYAYHEYKDTYKGGGKPTVQRLRDRGHRWDGDGINTILPNSLLQGLLGYPFICPDMIGGGEWSYNEKPDFRIDEELFIRMAQLSVFFPMMQFSWAPWRVLSKEAAQTVVSLGHMHARFAPEIYKIIEESAVSGEPVLRCLEYEFPHEGYEKIDDEFLCGSELLVCPVVTKGTFEKDIVIPDGKWRDEAGAVYEKGVYRMKTPVERLLYFRRVKE